jgi:hypothetical protein
MSLCAKPGCKTAAKCSCSGCGREQYCGSACQKLDWKVHKSMCPILKKLSINLQPFREVESNIREVQVSTKGNDIRVLEHLLLYIDYQYGKEITGKDYRERNGQKVMNYDIDISCSLNIYSVMVGVHANNQLLSHLARSNKTFPYLTKMASILTLWIEHLDSDARNRIVNTRRNDTNNLLKSLYNTEHQLAWSAILMNQLDVAEGHCQRSLICSKRIQAEKKEKTTSVFTALGTCAELRRRQENWSGAVTFAEEAYNLVVMAYDCVHPQVQEAAGSLINCLVRTGVYNVYILKNII